MQGKSFFIFFGISLYHWVFSLTYQRPSIMGAIITYSYDAEQKLPHSSNPTYSIVNNILITTSHQRDKQLRLQYSSRGKAIASSALMEQSFPRGLVALCSANNLPVSNVFAQLPACLVLKYLVLSLLLNTCRRET